MTRIVGREGLSELFDVRVDYVCDTADLDLGGLLWTRALAWVEDLETGAALRWDGVVQEAEYLGATGGRYAYGLRLRPALSVLGYRVQSRIFQDLDAVAVVKAVLAGHGFEDGVDTRWELVGSVPRRAYCVQYRESDLDFVQRLLEDEGIFYWVEHGEAGPVLCFGDSPGSHRAIVGEPAVTYTRVEHALRESVTDLVYTSRLCTDVFVTRDWNWERPDAPREARHAEPGTAGFERYEYPGGFADNADGSRRAKLRLAEQRVRGRVLQGRTNSLRLAPGRTFAVGDALGEEFQNDWLVLGVEYLYQEHEGPQARAQQPFRARFRAAPAGVPFRPPRKTPRPRVEGRELAVVEGPPGEEIQVDAHGRVKVRFRWDRGSAQAREGSSCWIRVQQPGTSGSMFVPRVGWEVAVGFLDGDPDRPVILGRLFHGEQLPEYALPDERHRSTLKTPSSPGAHGTNELRWDDSPGGMELFAHAARDFALVAGGDLVEVVGGDARRAVGTELESTVAGGETVTVGGDQRVRVAGNTSETTGGARTVTVGADEVWEVAEGYGLTCEGARTEVVKGPVSVLVAGDVSETFLGKCTRTVGSAQAVNAAGGILEAVAGNKTETVAGVRVESVGKTHAVVVRGDSKLTAKDVEEVSGTDHRVSAKRDLHFQVEGDMDEVCGEDWVFSGKTVKVTADELSVSIPGSKTALVAKGGKLTLAAAAIGGKGTQALALKGRIDFREASPDDVEGEVKKKDWVEIVLEDESDPPRPVPYVKYELKLPDGSTRQGLLDAAGRALVVGIDPGDCEVSFPELDAASWEKA